MLPNFFCHRKNTCMCSETKKICSSHCARLQNIIFEHIMPLFLIINLIFVSPGFCLELSFPQNFKRPQMVDEESGTPNFQHEGSPSNTRPPKTPISMCGHQAQGRKSATKSSVQKKIKKSKKCLFFIYVRSCT